MAGSVVSDLAGRMLAGRYLLQAAIGTGASGRVYVADDTRLRRRVAVKVLHAALAEDTAFLRRFRAEAQLAASLHHPHIVTVHDWGEDDLPFMVLELLEGGSLRGMLDQGTRLSVSQAARVGRDVASALDYAHARGVLHRDIKPANLLFDEHGIVRVADFGLARALAEASWTEPAGAVFGTARYSSPEQALGTPLDARSDLYSLALVLVEAVTGRVPFTADTTIGMLTARTQRSLTAPEELGPIGPIAERAGRVDASERYPDAATMRQALADAADSLPPPGPLTLAGMVDKVDPNPTRAVPEKTAILFDQDQDSAELMADPQPAPVTMLMDRFSASPRRMVPYVVAIVLAITVALAAIALARVGAQAVQVPGLIGLTQIDARTTASRAGLDVVGVEEEQAPDPPGVVIAQQPAAGMWTRGEKMHLTVSSGPAKVVIPAVVQQAWPDAQRTLDTAGFVYKTPVSEQYDETVPVGVVLSVTPAPGARVAPNTELQITLSKGHAPVKVPDLIGSTYDAASAALEAVHLHAQRGDDQFSDTVESGLVMATNPGSDGAAPYDGSVVVVVSKGPDLVLVPDVTGMPIEVAQNSIELQGLKVGTVTDYRKNGVVIAENPPAGTQVTRGTPVDLLVQKL